MTQMDVMVAGSLLVALVIIATAALRMWQGWLQLKTRELELHRPLANRVKSHCGPFGTAGGSREAAARIELADLKERIRKLEAIASGVDL